MNEKDINRNTKKNKMNFLIVHESPKTKRKDLFKEID